MTQPLSINPCAIASFPSINFRLLNDLLPNGNKKASAFEEALAFIKEP
jgi:hypothetical protein